MNMFGIFLEILHPFKFLENRIHMPLTLFKSRLLEFYRLKTQDKVNNFREYLLKAGLIGLTTSVVVWLSIFLYVAFYYSYVPNITHSRPVHLQFEPCRESKEICSYPSAHVQLTKKQQLLMIGQPYILRLALDMPESPINKELGMFMSCCELRARDGTAVGKSCRSGLMRYQSPLLTKLILLLFLPMYVVEFFQEKQTLELELFSHYEDDQMQPVTDVFVEIQSHQIELYSAMLYIEAHFTGLRYIMFHWPMLSAVVGISTNLMFVAFVCALSWNHIQNDEENDESAQQSYSEGISSSGGAHDFLFDSEDFQELFSENEDYDSPKKSS